MSKLDLLSTKYLKINFRANHSSTQWIIKLVDLIILIFIFVIRLLRGFKESRLLRAEHIQTLLLLTIDV
jgi:hypothetical protein